MEQIQGLANDRLGCSRRAILALVSGGAQPLELYLEAPSSPTIRRHFKFAVAAFQTFISSTHERLLVTSFRVKPPKPFVSPIKDNYKRKSSYNDALNISYIAKMPDRPEKPGNAMNEAQQKAEAKTGEVKKKATAQDHQANLGPVKADNLPQPASKEELKKRTAELNQ